MSKEYTSHLPVCVVGHKHPDTDAVCSAIAYANYKRLTSEGEYIAFRAGELNEETRFVLKEWGVEEPPLLTDVRTQVRDIEIRRIGGVSGDLSMKRAWQLMEEADVVTLCITRGEKLKGLITTGDIVRSYMDIYDNDFLSKAHTSYKNIIDTLDAEMILGDPAGVVKKGKVMIGAASPDVMEQLIGRDDVVIVGNRYEAQLCAIELDVQMLIVCGGAEVAQTIVKMAEEHHCAILKTKHDTFTTARLINQSVPVRYFMKSENLITFGQDDFIEDIQEVMAQKRFRYFPIVDEDGTYIGMISRRNFLGANRKKLILMDHNERAQAVNGVESAEILEIIDHHRVATVETVGPVFFRGQPLGSTSTIVYQMYHEQDLSIDKTTAALLLSAILS
ncbi:MAG: putative manganese-dependent inorganic diphosphatase, partial [Lachnospiraceae bacterium]|nr:putative manganese-dependent inorganic diphosphatase [Lachnospiraceae bacterium]